MARRKTASTSAARPSDRWAFFAFLIAFVFLCEIARPFRSDGTALMVLVNLGLLFAYRAAVQPMRSD